MQGDSPTFVQYGSAPLDLKSADSILKAAGRDPARNEIDKIAMLRGINLCYHWYGEARFFSTSRGESDRRQYLEKVYKKAKALDVLLSKNYSWLPTGAPPSLSRRYRAPINEIIANIDCALRPPPKPSRAYHDSFKTRSPFEWLVAYYLPDVFGLLNIGPSDTLEQMLAQKGPYVRFARAVLAEFKISVDGRPYSSESVAKALRSRFVGQRRIRRKTSERPDHYAFWRHCLLRKEMGLLPPPIIPDEPQAGFYLLPKDDDVGDGQN
jgi:hypothetical protein